MQVENFQREWCLRRLQAQAVGRQVDTTIDRYLIEQVNASHVGDNPEGHVLKCQIGGCAAQCVMVNEVGILREVSESGVGLCEQ